MAGLRAMRQTALHMEGPMYQTFDVQGPVLDRGPCLRRLRLRAVHGNHQRQHHLLLAKHRLAARCHVARRAHADDHRLIAIRIVRPVRVPPRSQEDLLCADLPRAHLLRKLSDLGRLGCVLLYLLRCNSDAFQVSETEARQIEKASPFYR